MVKFAHQSGKVEVLDLVVSKRIAAGGIKVRSRFFDHLQGHHALVVRRGDIPVLEGNALTRPGIQDEVVAYLAELQVVVLNTTAQTQRIVAANTGFDDILAIALVKCNDISTGSGSDRVVTLPTYKYLITSTAR